MVNQLTSQPIDIAIPTAMCLCMDKLLNRPIGHWTRAINGQVVPGARPLYEVSVNICCLRQDTKSKHTKWPQRHKEWQKGEKQLENNNKTRTAKHIQNDHKYLKNDHKSTQNYQNLIIFGQIQMTLSFYATFSLEILCRVRVLLPMTRGMFSVFLQCRSTGMWIKFTPPSCL